MTDDEDLNRLRDHLRAAPPPPDPAARMAALEAALAGFDILQQAPQGSEAPPRPIPDRPKRSGWIGGVLDMLKTLSHAPLRKGFLMGTSSLAVLAVAVIALGPSLREAPPEGPLYASPDPEPAQSAQNAPAPETPLAQPMAKSVDAPEPGPVTEPMAAPQEALALEAEAPLAEAPVAETLAAPSPVAPSSGGVMVEQARRMAAPGFGGGEDAAVALPADTEAFAHADANPVKAVDEAPVSTFSVDVDTASYAVIRQSLEAGHLPPKEAVRIEEMVNYFPYAYPQPEGDAPFRPEVTVFQTPWNPGTRLVRIGLQGRSAEVTARPPLNLVFLVDTSGSMEDPRKLPLLQQALRLVLPQLRPEDQVAIIAYAGSAGVVLPPTTASDTATITAALEGLTSGGGTAGEAGLAQAYALAARMQAEGEVSRILLATDGDFNLGLSDPEALKDFVAEKRKSGTYLSVLGFGRGNLDDATMQALAQNGNGIAAYIDTAQEARKVLVDQLSGALFPLADDVKVQVEWNPAAIAEYRLIGYETRALAREDFNNDRVDAGEIGAGLQVTALYEVTAPDSAARLTDPLRYGSPPAGDAGELGFLRLRWKAPGASDSRLIEAPIPATLSEADSEARFAAAIAGFGQLLTGAPYLGDWGWRDAIALAEAARGDDPFGYRIEAVNLMRLAGTLDR